MAILLLVGALNGIGQVVMRWGGLQAKEPFNLSNFAQWAWSSRWWLLGLVITWGSGLGWAFVLRKMRLVVALPLFVGVSYVLSLVGGVWLLSERPSPPQWVGVLLVFVGILLIASGRLATP